MTDIIYTIACPQAAGVWLTIPYVGQYFNYRYDETMVSFIAIKVSDSTNGSN